MYRYPASDDDFGLLLEDDIEVSPFYYMWLKYALMAYHYDPTVSLPELNAIALYTPRVIEVVKERPHWNASSYFSVHPNTPYLHQLPCSWGALYFPRRWREFYKYMGMRFTEDAKQNPVQIPKSRTNGWQVSAFSTSSWRCGNRYPTLGLMFTLAVRAVRETDLADF